MIIVTHTSRAFGMQLPIADGDDIRVCDHQHYELATLSGAFVRRLIEHHLAAVALQQALAVVVERPLTTPYRKALARAPFTRDTQAQFALSRRSRKKPV